MGLKARATDRERDVDGLASRVLLVSLALYAVSFCLPALDEPRHVPVRGYAAFLMAFFYPAIYSLVGVALLVREADPRGLLVMLFFLPWSANLAYWLAAHRLHSGRRRGVVTLGALAVLLGLSFPAMSTAFWLSFPADRRGPPLYVYREGYWLWLGSMALVSYGGREGRASRPGRAEVETLAQACDD